jgi:plastocyanin
MGHVKIVSRSVLAGVVGVLVMGVGATACSSGQNVPADQMGTALPSGPHPAPSTVVILQSFSFDPSVVTIKAGQTIEWIWEDHGAPHNVTFAGFHSPTLTAGTYYHTFTTPGTYPYSSTLNYTMKGEVIVTPG